jgi:hypothetical protein
MTLAYGPACASLGNRDGTSTNDVPDAVLWASFVRQSVARYRAMGVRHFGLWNEPNLGGFFEGTAADYVRQVVLPGIPAVRQGCADAGHDDCRVLGPDLAHVGDYDVFLEATLRALDAAGASFDILTHHIYQGFDVQVWQGDSFVNALDQRRFSFTRRSLLDVLRDTGHAPGGVPATEVWITETGYRARPPTDPAQMNEQSRYLTRVLDEQLSREWFTNSFFYEILDSEDEIDGFGITRRDGAGFLRKPAYAAVRDRIASTPSLSTRGCAPPLPQCADGIDNDGDGKIDLADRGCASASDGDESDDPPSRRYDAPMAGAAAVDGALSEWSGAEFAELGPTDYVALTGGSPDAADLRARFAIRWNAAALYLAIAVDDDVHRNDQAGAEIWRGDSIQVAFDLGSNGGNAYDETDDHELGFALTNGGTVAWRWHAPAGLAAFDPDMAIVRSASRTTYEIRLPAQSLGLAALAQGRSFGFSVLVNENDGSGREGYLQWTPGIGASKNPGAFGMVRLVAGPDGGADAGPPPDAGAPRDGGAPPDGGAGSAAGASPEDAGPGSPGAADGGGARGAVGGCGVGDGSPGLIALLLVALATIGSGLSGRSPSPRTPRIPPPPRPHRSWRRMRYSAGRSG